MPSWHTTRQNHEARTPFTTAAVPRGRRRCDKFGAKRNKNITHEIANHRYRKGLTVEQQRFEGQLLFFHVIPLKGGWWPCHPRALPLTSKVWEEGKQEHLCQRAPAGWEQGRGGGWTKLLSDPPDKVSTESGNKEQLLLRTDTPSQEGLDWTLNDHCNHKTFYRNTILIETCFSKPWNGVFLALP